MKGKNQSFSFMMELIIVIFFLHCQQLYVFQKKNKWMEL